MTIMTTNQIVNLLKADYDPDDILDILSPSSEELVDALDYKIMEEQVRISEFLGGYEDECED